jgi:Leucine-rich repeat (LRR) protein
VEGQPWQARLFARLEAYAREGCDGVKRLDLRALGITSGIWHSDEWARLAQFSDVEELDLSSNCIDFVQLPSPLLPKLRQLNLSSNDLGYWARFDQLPLDEVCGASLQVLDVSFNSMGHVRLTRKAPFAESLHTLDVSYNAFPSHSEGGPRRPRLQLNGLTRLTTLRMRGNLFREVPRLAHLSALRHLDLGDNPLRCNYQHLFGLPQLAGLGLANVGMSRLPAALLALTSLRRLDLSRNPLPPSERRRIRRKLSQTDLVLDG